jgi:hypothetical protein
MAGPANYRSENQGVILSFAFISIFIMSISVKLLVDGAHGTFALNPIFLLSGFIFGLGWLLTAVSSYYTTMHPDQVVENETRYYTAGI